MEKLAPLDRCTALDVAGSRTPETAMRRPFSQAPCPTIPVNNSKVKKL